jgi:hypothetical protein
MPTSRRYDDQLTWILVLGCVALAALLGLSCVLSDGDLGVSSCSANESLLAPVALSGELRPVPRRSPAVPAAELYIGAPNVLAAVPGGLCLLD